MVDLYAFIVQEGRSVVLDAEVLAEYGYDEVIESARPGVSWELSSIERCCDDHIILVFDKDHE